MEMGRDGQGSSTPSLILRMGGRIEPAEPEPPPTHSSGRVGEDAMGWPGQLVQPCWLGAGGVPLVVRNWWRGRWLGLSFRRFFVIFSCLGHGKSPKIAKTHNSKKKHEKYQKNDSKV